jgi:malonyl CoA-acyl carrier protein transacylase
MKKLLAFVVLAGSLVACNNDGTSTENTADSIEHRADSMQERVENKADSTVNVIENKADSTIEAVKDANKKVDTVKHD